MVVLVVGLWIIWCPLSSISERTTQRTLWSWKLRGFLSIYLLVKLCVILGFALAVFLGTREQENASYQTLPSAMATPGRWVYALLICVFSVETIGSSLLLCHGMARLLHRPSNESREDMEGKF